MLLKQYSTPLPVQDRIRMFGAHSMHFYIYTSLFFFFSLLNNKYDPPFGFSNLLASINNHWFSKKKKKTNNICINIALRRKGRREQDYQLLTEHAFLYSHLVGWQNRMKETYCHLVVILNGGKVKAIFLLFISTCSFWWHRFYRNSLYTGRSTES